MIAKVIVLRPRPDTRPRPGSRPRPGGRPVRPGRPAASSPSLVGAVSVEWSPERGAYVAACARCTDTALPLTLDTAETWADTHVCDPELAALLEQVCGGSAA